MFHNVSKCCGGRSSVKPLSVTAKFHVLVLQLPVHHQLSIRLKIRFTSNWIKAGLLMDTARAISSLSLIL